MASDAFIVGEGWLSEHFFTTDAKSQSFQALVAARRKEWDELEASNHATSRSRFSAFRAQLEGQLAELQAGSADEDIETNLYLPLREVLGFVGGSFTIEAQGPVTRVSTPGIVDGAPLVLISARPVDSLEDLLQKDEPTLLASFEVDGNENHNINSVARLLSTLFIEDEGPNYALVFAGKWMLIAERERWPEGRYLAVDLQLVAQRNDQKKAGEVDRALTCISAESLGPDAEGDIWWNGVLEESIKHTVGVSQDLREGVRLSIEIIANDVVQRRLRAGMPPLPASEAQTLAKQSLRFLYRILFLLFAEASPELKVLPVGASEYEEGYSLDRLRELTLVPLVTETAENGTHFYQSLAVLFDLVDRGHGNTNPEEESVLPQGLVFNGLKADLFLPKATSLIDDVKLSDSALQQVLTHLLLSKEQKGKDRGFISYADLGINQLGAVYEGLMSYTGFFAETPLYEVAKDGDASKGSWVVPTDRAQGLDPKDFVKRTNPITGEEQPVIHEQGSFVFRLAGRERQQSASYYTPEVLTRFTVSQALEELLDQDGKVTTAEEILQLTLCEPALGSGAFAIEAVRQLAEEYLRRRQNELGERIAPEDYPQELQKVKSYIAIHNVYGVDLNATAVELAEITLWLETMSDGLDAPWFGLHLRRGNSLVGALSNTYSSEVLKSTNWKKLSGEVSSLTHTVKMSDEQETNTGIFQFLLPSDGWGSSTKGKESSLAGESVNKILQWKNSLPFRFSKSQIDRLEAISIQVRELADISARRLYIANQQIQRQVSIWGAESQSTNLAVSRFEIEQTLRDPEGALGRLRIVMNAWCSLWFWPIAGNVEGYVAPPEFETWLDVLEKLLGKSSKMAGKKTKKSIASLKAGTQALEFGNEWINLEDEEQLFLGFSGAHSTSDLFKEHQWLSLSETIAEQNGFFHWELEFSNVFLDGGFDLQIGNPPWVRPRSDVSALLAEGDPWWQLATKATQNQIKARRDDVLALPGMAQLLVTGTAEIAALAAFAGSTTTYPLLDGINVDLYRCFMMQTWRNQKNRGVIGLIHPDSHFTDEKAGLLRAQTYKRLARHWHFQNMKILFEIDAKTTFGVHIYKSLQDHIDFQMASNIYHPSVIERSLDHDGSGIEPGLKNDEGSWDLRPHASRIIRVDEDVLKSWHALLEEDSDPVLQTKMLYLVNNKVSEVVTKLTKANRLSDIDIDFSSGWNETTDREKGIFDVKWERCESLDEVILQGPHFFVGNPYYKYPNPTLKNNQDWTRVNLDHLANDEIYITSFKREVSKEKYSASYTQWSGQPASNYFRFAWRSMGASSNERTLIGAIIPPGPAHVHAVTSAGNVKHEELLQISGSLQALLNDFLVRVMDPSTISRSVLKKLVLAPSNHPLYSDFALRTLRLNCLTYAYSEIWEDGYSNKFSACEWANYSSSDSRSISAVSPKWSSTTPLRNAKDRRRALLENDVIFAIMAGISSEELSAVYRAQFGVLRKYDRERYYFDANGNSVPTNILNAWKKDGTPQDNKKYESVQQGLNEETFSTPFENLDRETEIGEIFEFFLRKMNV